MSNKRVGDISHKRRLWEDMAGDIINLHVPMLNEILIENFNSEDPKDRKWAAEKTIDLIEFVRPKMARTTIVGDDKAPPVQIVISKEL